MLPGMFEMLIILVIVGIVFGAGKLPQVMEAMGHGMKMFRDASADIDEAVNDVKNSVKIDPNEPK